MHIIWSIDPKDGAVGLHFYPIASGAGEDVLLKETERSSSGSAQGSSQKKQPQPLLIVCFDLIHIYRKSYSLAYTYNH